MMSILKILLIFFVGFLMVSCLALPGPPTNVRVSEITAASVRLSWSYNEPEDLQYYVIQFKPKYANQAFSEISGIITMYYSVRNLSPYTEYEMYVIAVNNIGRGPPSAPVVVTTGETEPGTAPRNVQVRPLSSSTMVINWDEPETPNGQVLGYKVYYTTNSELPITQWESQMVDNNQLTTISELIPHTIYTIKVQAYTSVGHGPLSSPVHVKTQQGVPSQPSNLRASDIGETSVTLQWSKPTHSGESIMSYELYWNDTYAKEKHHRRIPISESYTLTGLYPDTIYYVWLAARSQRGEGATTPPIPVKTKQYVPGAPPSNVVGEAVSPTAIRVSWDPPPVNRSNGNIIYYKIQFVEADRSDSEAIEIKFNGTSITLDELKRWTSYRIRVLAGTSVGDGPSSLPITVQTLEDVPGDPQDVKVIPINSTTIKVNWKPPQARDRNGIILGYHVHVQEIKEEGKNFLNEPMKFDVVGDTVLEINITSLQPDTMYSVQVAALTRKGDGDRSPPVNVRTPGGVPSRPDLILKFIEREPTVTIELEWSRPSQTYGELRGYRLRYGVKDHLLKEVSLKGSHITSYRINDLERGVEYEFRVAGQNHIGVGQEAIKYMHTPEGPPTGPPTNITYHFQTPDVVCISWSPPTREHRNGQILKYDIQFQKKSDHNNIIVRNVTHTKAVFTNLEENTEYVFHIRAYTSQGVGPSSEKIPVQTERDIGRAPMSVKAVATSDSSVEVWWEAVRTRGKVIGYKIFYTMTAVEDLDEWQQKSVGLTESADLVNLEKYAQYAIAVAAKMKNGLGRLSEKVTVKVKPEDVPLNLRAHEVTTHSMTLSWSPPIRLNPVKYKISFDTVKEFVDSQGITQTQVIPKVEIILSDDVRSHTINELSPFTTYNVNVSAIPTDNSYRPPTKITVTTQMAAPQPMVKPDFYGVVNGEEIHVILPQASEEYGPISHYYLIVVPENELTVQKNPDQFLTDELISNVEKIPQNSNLPYIAAKFPQRNIPYTYHLGTGERNDGFVNYRLEHGKRYRIFVRAVVDTPQKHLYTSSPFSEFLSLDMREVPPGDPPRRPDPNIPTDNDVKVSSQQKEAGVLLIIGPIISALLLSVILVILFLLRKRRQRCKTPDQMAVTRPLIQADINNTIAPSDPVEIRRINFQTPAMISHPPIPIFELANHIERLKANDNLKFSQEYESIEPGQQFTWDHSNMEVNKPKNRYANVIAYDHSRVILPNENGVLGSDYINANYCDGYRKHNAYVATQGPLQETFADFWRMCWELKSATIVMMTKLEERTRIKCDQYWPTRGTESYGTMSVQYRCSLIMTVLLLSSLIFSFVTVTYSANILACLPTPSFSHQIAYREIWKQLSLRGHKVTLITADPVNDPKLTNLTEIDMHFSYAVFKNVSTMAENESDWWDFQETIRPFFKGVADAQLAHEKIQDLIHNRNHKFDLVLSEFLFAEFLAFAEIYKTPKIIFSTLDVIVVFHNAIGNTIHPVLYPDVIAPFYPPLTFWERVKNTFYTYHVLDYIHRYTYSDKDEIIRTFFNSSTTTRELISDIDLLLLNINPVINNIRAMGPSTITIGDISRVQSSVPLTEDFQEYLDNAKEGFIYFSLGSNVKSRELQKESLTSIMQALGEMPYKVLWKFEDDDLPGKPENVKLVKWANQRAVLAHPNIKLFVTQGGLQSMEEGIYNEVPFVVIPFFGDQDQNALLMKGKGIAAIVDRHPFIKKENLKNAMLEVLNNPSYRNAVKRLKQLALDMPMSGADKAVWWIEYVIRNKGAKHLRNPTADLPLYQYYLVDVIGFFVAVSVISISILLFILKRFVRLLKVIVSKPLAENKKIQ